MNLIFTKENKGNKVVKNVLFCFLGCFLFQTNGFALGEINFIETTATPGSFALVEKSAATILVDTNDWPGVIRAANDLVLDIHRVSGKTPGLIQSASGSPPSVHSPVIIGTIGKSKLIGQLIGEKKIDVSGISNRWESFFLQVVPQPFPGVDRALVICGSDKRGTIYGIYDLSGQIGVSPWHFWADVPSQHHDQLFVRAGKFTQGPPSVKYRGIFLNDEAPDLSNWIQEKYGSAPGYKHAANYGPAFYTNLFELMLRIRANYLWPAMWNNAFNEDDANNPRLADEYGIVMGTSHQEPMMRAQKEWDRGLGKKYGSWNYAKIPTVVSNFWRAGIERNKDYENLITIGLRGANDTPMAEGGPEANRALLEKIVNDQRTILADVINSDVTKVPQVWCLYKEVMDYYNAGMRVPDDVTLLWAEDNWGNVRRLPDANERNRTGGAGIYYHFDYHGGPRNYQWINTDPIPKIWDQMSLAKQYGADRIWIVNVGHFKGYEFPLEFFMNLAWNSSRWANTNLDEFTRLWTQEQFGAKYAQDIAKIISAYTKFNGRRKPELLDANTYSVANYNEFENVVADYESLAAKAEKISEELPQENRDAFYELVLFPVKACAQLNAMYLAAAKNHLYARQGRASANDFAAQTRELFVAETNLMNYFNTQFAGGKWNHFMDQPFIGYTSWNEPRRGNNLDAVHLQEIEIPDAAAMGVAVENSDIAVTNGEISLPQFDSLNRQRFYVDVFNKGKTPFTFSTTASAPWIHISLSSRGNENQTKESETSHVVSYKVKKQQRIWVGVDWSKIPQGQDNGEIKISGANGDVTVKITAFNRQIPGNADVTPANSAPSETRRRDAGAPGFFVEGDGYVSMEAAHYTRKIDNGANRWIEIPNYGNTLSGMRATGPDYVIATPEKNSPCLEYKMYLFSTGKMDVISTVAPTLNFLPGRALRYAVSFDDEPPRVITIVPANFNAGNGNRDWEQSVRNNCRKVKSTDTISAPGYHTLKIWMVDPAVVLEKIVVDCGGVKPSYLGPPESFRK